MSLTSYTLSLNFGKSVYKLKFVKYVLNFKFDNHLSKCIFSVIGSLNFPHASISMDFFPHALYGLKADFTATPLTAHLYVPSSLIFV